MLRFAPAQYFVPFAVKKITIIPRYHIHTI